MTRRHETGGGSAAVAAMPVGLASEVAAGSVCHRRCDRCGVKCWTSPASERALADGRAAFVRCVPCVAADPGDATFSMLPGSAGEVRDHFRRT